ncbi:MAG: C-GCAxxG-C-C family (seleno)protein [Bacillota bacterium]
MLVNTARNYYLGKEGCKRLNCAQAVICAFKEKYNLDEDIVGSFDAYGGGRAPEGVCGAYYAVKYIMEKGIMAGRVSEFEQYFIEHAGAVKCIEIKSAKKLSCVGCVERSSEFLAKNE